MNLPPIFWHLLDPRYLTHPDRRLVSEPIAFRYLQMVYLAALCSDDGRLTQNGCPMTRRQLAANLGIHGTRLYRILKWLTEVGLITIDGDTICISGFTESPPPVSSRPSASDPAP